MKYREGDISHGQENDGGQHVDAGAEASGGGGSVRLPDDSASGGAQRAGIFSEGGDALPDSSQPGGAGCCGEL